MSRRDSHPSLRLERQPDMQASAQSAAEVSTQVSVDFRWRCATSDIGHPQSVENAPHLTAYILMKKCKQKKMLVEVTAYAARKLKC